MGPSAYGLGARESRRMRESVPPGAGAPGSRCPREPAHAVRLMPAWCHPGWVIHDWIIQERVGGVLAVGSAAGLGPQQGCIASGWMRW
jgi:hypothetical protein